MLKNDWLRMAAVLASLWLAPLGSYARQQSSSQQDSSQQTGDPVADAARKARSSSLSGHAPYSRRRPRDRPFAARSPAATNSVAARTFLTEPPTAMRAPQPSST